MKKLLAFKLFFLTLVPSLWAQTKKKAVEVGKASFYADKFHGRRTASGERFSKWGLTAAHRTLPFGTKVRVTNPANGRSVMVRITDRGPHNFNRVIDLSKAAGRRLGLTVAGAQQVMVQTVSLGKGQPGHMATDTARPLPVHAMASASLACGGSYTVAGLKAVPHGYALQVASYYSSESALYDAAALAQAGYREVFIQVPESGGPEPMYRVLVGEYPTREKALASQPSLSGKGWESVPARHM